MRLTILLACLAVAVGSAADRHWQTGKWTDVSVKRRMVDFGPGSSPFGRGSSAPSSAPPMRAMADIRVYVIDTESLHLELEDVVQVGKRSIDAVVGLPVTFALDKGSAYIRDSDGVEHKLRVTKKTGKPKA